MFFKFIKFFLNIFWLLHKPIVLKNKFLRNKHRGETCFIFANGGSLKFYDISKLPDNPCLVTAYNLIDKRIEKLNVEYYVTTDSYSLYSVLFNTYPHVRKFQKSKIRALYSSIFKKYKDIRIFVNVTNFYSTICRRSKLNYFHYFNDKTSYSDDLAGSFSNCRGALDTMLGIAKYLGFKKAILIGCDYLGVPPTMGHFYADNKPFIEKKVDLSDYRERIKIAAKGIDVTVILPEGSISPEFNYDSYENYFNLDKKYQNNNIFIDDKYIKMLREAARYNQAIMDLE